MIYGKNSHFGRIRCSAVDYVSYLLGQLHIIYPIAQQPLQRGGAR